MKQSEINSFAKVLLFMYTKSKLMLLHLFIQSLRVDVISYIRILETLEKPFINRMITR